MCRLDSDDAWYLERIETTHATKQREIKFRTEIVPVQDMLASLSGDAFAQVMPPQNEGYDVPLDLDEGDMVDDDVPQNFEFVNSFYRHELEPTSDEIADSMLEDDLGRLANPPITRKIGDKNLLESFREQYEIAPGGEPLDFREDHFGTRSAFQGKAIDGTLHRTHMVWRMITKSEAVL
jgi:autophagy-related protein 2